MILITQPRVGTAHNEILSLHFAARELGWEVLPAPGGWRLDELPTTAGAPYGSQIFCEVIVHQTNWKLKLNSFDWLAKLPKKFRQRQIDFMTLKEASLLDETKFIKPADDKCFDAKIYKSGDLIPPQVLSDDTPVLVSDVVHFVAEYRCFVKDQKVLTTSCYVYQDEVANPSNWYRYDLSAIHPESYVNEMLKSVQSENSVIDVGLLETGDWAIIESNPAWASGLYGCDPLQCLQVIGSAVEP